MASFFNFLYLKKSTQAAVFFLVFVFSLSVLVPFISPYSDDIYGAVFFENKNQVPSNSHWFGTDSAGRDVFTLTIYGAMSSFKVAFGVVFLSVLIGVPIGLVAGVSSGSKTDEVLMRMADGFLAFPPIVLPIIITTVLGPSLNNVIIGIAISWFPWYARISRSQAIIIKSSDWIIDLGPEGGNKGGEIVFEGTPEQMIKDKNSITGKFLQKKFFLF